MIHCDLRVVTADLAAFIANVRPERALDRWNAIWPPSVPCMISDIVENSTLTGESGD